MKLETIPIFLVRGTERNVDCLFEDKEKFKIFLKDAVESVKLSADDGEWWIKPKRILRDINTYEKENASSGPGAGLSLSGSEASLIKKYRVSPAQITRLKRNESVSTHTIEMFCKILGCKVGDIMEYIPDEIEQ